MSQTGTSGVVPGQRGGSNELRSHKTPTDGAVPPNTSAVPSVWTRSDVGCSPLPSSLITGAAIHLAHVHPTRAQPLGVGAALMGALAGLLGVVARVIRRSGRAMSSAFAIHCLLPTVHARPGPGSVARQQECDVFPDAEGAAGLRPSGGEFARHPRSFRLGAASAASGVATALWPANTPRRRGSVP